MASLRPVLPLILANTQEREGEPLKAGTVMLPYLATSLLRLRDPALSQVRPSSFGRAQSLGTCDLSPQLARSARSLPFVLSHFDSWWVYYRNCFK